MHLPYTWPIINSALFDSFIVHCNCFLFDPTAIFWVDRCSILLVANTVL